MNIEKEKRKEVYMLLQIYLIYFSRTFKVEVTVLCIANHLIGDI